MSCSFSLAHKGALLESHQAIKGALFVGKTIRSKKNFSVRFRYTVIPAKAGIQRSQYTDNPACRYRPHKSLTPAILGENKTDSGEMEAYPRIVRIVHFQDDFVLFLVDGVYRADDTADGHDLVIFFE